MLKYEAILENPEKDFHKVIKFLNLDFDAEKFKKALRNSSFKEMKKIKENAKDEGRGIPFVREGSIYRKNIYPEDIEKRFIEKFEKLLKKFNYLDCEKYI